MIVKLAGGVGEHGRNCFFVRGDTVSFLVDCGLAADAAKPYPKLTGEEIEGLSYVFLTHSHRDHTGALPWLESRGFSGTIVGTSETLSQLKEPGRRAISLESFHTPRFWRLCWGRSGHCVGSVWYHFVLEGRSLLFSGDYREDSPVYAVDPIRGIKADLAILDSAYGPELRTGDEMREAFITGARLCCERQMPLLLPVPKYGRGLELLYLLHRRHLQLPLYGDEHFTEQFRLARRDGQWVTEHFRHELEGITVRPLNGVPESGVCFLSEPQLDTTASEALAAQFSQAGGVMITGTTDRDTGSWRLCSSGHAAFCRIPVHCTDIDRKQLEGKNCFCRVVPYHTSSWQSAQMVLSI